MVKEVVQQRQQSPMSAKWATILRWTGRGSVDDLQSSVSFLLAENDLRGKVTRIGQSIVIEGPEPLGVASLIGHLPGVAWVAAGASGGSVSELAVAAEKLARNYLGRGDRFSVEAEGTGGAIASDLAGSIVARILGAARGSRVSSDSPKVRFRAAMDRGKGAVGVEVMAGPGGVPTGKDSVTCFVSGGRHSSVLAWFAVLQGFRVRLVHVSAGDERLQAVARLYSELSHRSDPRWLALEVLDGDTVPGALSRHAESGEPVFAGVSATVGEKPGRIPKVLTPLFLMPEERFRMEFDSLGIKEADSPVNWKASRRGSPSARRFGGKVADVSGVLDGLR